MLLLGPTSIPLIRFCSIPHHQRPLVATSTLRKSPAPASGTPNRCRTATTIFLATAAATVLMVSGMMAAEAIETTPIQATEDSGETFSNIPQTLSGDCVQGRNGDCVKARIQKPKSRKAESCTIKCVTTCIRGGDGSPGEGPLNVRRPLVVFKQGFRSRHYCLVECSDICNLIRDGDDGP